MYLFVVCVTSTFNVPPIGDHHTLVGVTWRTLTSPAPGTAVSFNYSFNKSFHMHLSICFLVPQRITENVKILLNIFDTCTNNECIPGSPQLMKESLGML